MPTRHSASFEDILGAERRAICDNSTNGCAACFWTCDIAPVQAPRKSRGANISSIVWYDVYCDVAEEGVSWHLSGLTLCSGTIGMFPLLTVAPFQLVGVFHFTSQTEFSG